MKDALLLLVFLALFVVVLCRSVTRMSAVVSARESVRGHVCARQGGLDSYHDATLAACRARRLVRQLHIGLDKLIGEHQVLKFAACQAVKHFVVWRNLGLSRCST